VVLGEKLLETNSTIYFFVSGLHGIQKNNGTISLGDEENFQILGEEGLGLRN